MTDKITLELTLDELKTLDKHIEYNEETWGICDKIKYAYPLPKMTFQQEGDYVVVSYNNTTYYRLMGETTFSWYHKKGVSAYHPFPTLVMVTDAETERLLEGLYYNDVVMKKEQNVVDEPVQYETPMTEIEDVKAQIKVLQSKLSFLEELEKTKSPAEEAYKDWWGEYPGTEIWTNFDEMRWAGFQAGYHFAYEEKVKETAQERGERLHKDVERVVKESVKWCEENSDKDPLDCLKPQTPEETEKGMREAFRKAQQTEKWKELQRKIDEEDNDKNFKNSLDLIKEWGEKNKPLTLKELLWEWWEDIFTVDSDLDADASIDVLVDRIAKEFIPPSSDRNSYEWEKCLKMMRDKLR